MDKIALRDDNNIISILVEYPMLILEGMRRLDERCGSLYIHCTAIWFYILNIQAIFWMDYNCPPL